MRLQLALNVEDLERSIEFYSKMFGSGPSKVEQGYANFALENPPLKLVLFESAEQNGSINHLGVEVNSVDEVQEAHSRLLEAGLVTTGVEETTCCFADKTETWVSAPDTNRWEWYVKRGDADQFTGEQPKSSGAECCAPVGEASSSRAEVNFKTCC